jgi:DNA-binding CsgD family transcriptional regulator
MASSSDAGVHVSRILAKLGVAGRGEAAAIATGSASISDDRRR